MLQEILQYETFFCAVMLVVAGLLRYKRKFIPALILIGLAEIGAILILFFGPEQHKSYTMFSMPVVQFNVVILFALIVVLAANWASERKKST